jgi:hypothetical protein
MAINDNPDSLLNLVQFEETSTLGSFPHLDDEDVAFVEKILRSIEGGSKAIFVALHPDDRLQYCLVNTNRVGSLALLGRVMTRIAEKAEEE